MKLTATGGAAREEDRIARMKGGAIHRCERIPGGTLGTAAVAARGTVDVIGHPGYFGVSGGKDYAGTERKREQAKDDAKTEKTSLVLDRRRRHPECLSFFRDGLYNT